MNQLDVHKRIDELFEKEPNKDVLEEISNLISLNNDTKQYFFFKANVRWLSFLWDNGFLDVLKTKPSDVTSYNYRTPEINYLVAMAKEDPIKATEIILNEDLATTKENFNPELIDQILRICNSLPYEQLKLIILEKICKQKWVKLMSKFSHWGFEYDKMFSSLTEAKDFDTLLALVQAVIEVKPKEDLKNSALGFSSDNPFYFNDISYTKVFDYLIDIPNEFLEKALVLSTKVMGNIVLLGDEAESDETFSIREIYHLFDVDFFELELGEKNRLSPRDDVRELAAAIKTLLNKTFDFCKNDKEKIKSIYETYIKKLPNSRSMSRLNLYSLSVRPDIFTLEIKYELFRLFDPNTKYYGDIISGAEYEKLLSKSFSFLPTEVQNEYIDNVISFFKQKDQETDGEKWHMTYGSDLLSTVIDHLSKEKIKEIESLGYKLSKDHKPEPSITSPSFASVIRSQGELSAEEFADLSVYKIIDKLKNEWSPKNLSEKYKNIDPFHNKHNAEGIGNQIQSDFKNRPQEYINAAARFLYRGFIDQHYLYALFRGIEDFIKNNTEGAEKVDWSQLIKLFIAIKKSDTEKPFEDNKDRINSSDGWLSGWTAVHDSMADVLQLFLIERNRKTLIDFSEYRDNLFNLIKYLLSHKDPAPKDEETKTAKSISGNNNEVTDPFTMAINSVRGRAFQCLQYFIFPDGRQKDNPNKVIIKDDVKKLYEEVLDREQTKAIMFMFGHYLPSFYFRDIEWMQGLLPKIFSKEENRKYLSLAAWEGYLANSLYQEIFEDPIMQDLYKYFINLDAKDTIRRYFKDPDEGVATHIALAFIHYKNFDFEHPLFKEFWDKGTTEQQAEFVSFIGRAFINGSNSGNDEFLRKDPQGKKRILEFWDWLLDRSADSKIFAEFGFWISLKKDIFNPIWLAEHLRRTLEKSNGIIDWDYELNRNILELAKASPKEIIKATRLYFIEGYINNPKKTIYNLEREWFETFKLLYNCEDTKKDTYDLINDLIEKGGSFFWSLKDIIQNEK